MLKRIISSMALIVAMGCGNYAGAQIPRDDSRILDELSKISAQAVPEFVKATEALDAGRNEEAERGYRLVLEYAPNFVPALRRLSYAVSDPRTGLLHAKHAYDLDAHFFNLMAVISAHMSVGGEFDIHEANRLSRRLLEQAGNDADAYALVAYVSIRQTEPTLLPEALNGLRRFRPDDPWTYFFEAYQAAIDSDWSLAETRILQAQAVGLPPEVVQGFLSTTGIPGKLRTGKLLRYAGWGVLIWAAGLGVLLLVGVLLSRATLVAIGRSTPQDTAAPDQGMRVLRRIYSSVIGVTSVYYYISLPVVGTMVLGAGGGLLYLLFQSRYVPIKFALIIAVVTLVTLFALISSIFSRTRQEDPGPRLAREKAPELFGVLDEVAGAVGTSPVQTVFVVPEATVAVFERGGLLRQWSGHSERCLILGIAVLEGMSLDSFRSILAHEYGHFVNKDTAGGRLALHVRDSIHRSAEGMASGGAAGWYNPAWLFMNLFYRIYLRVTQGASRLQEVLADRYAAILYGADNFADGLRHVVRRSIEFDLVFKREMSQALNQSREAHNFYRLEVPGSWWEGVEHDEDCPTPGHAVDAAFEAAMQAEPSPFDSHPPPGQRIQWIQNVKGKEQAEPDRRLAWTMIPDPEKWQDEMTALMNRRVYDFIAAQQEMAAQQERDG